DGIRVFHVTGVQTCALPICRQVGGEPRVPMPGAQREVVGPQGRPLGVGSAEVAGLDGRTHAGTSPIASRMNRNASSSVMRLPTRSEERRAGTGTRSAACPRP